MIPRKNITLIFNDVWRDIEDNLETEHEKARMLDVMVGFYRHGEIPTFGEGEGEQALKVVFAGMIRGERLRELFNSDEVIRILISLEYDIKKVREFVGSLLQLLIDYTEYYKGDEWHIHTFPPYLKEAVMNRVNEGKSPFEAVAALRQRLEFIKKMDAETKDREKLNQTSGGKH